MSAAHLTPVSKQTDDERAIRKLTEDWLAAVKAKDVAALAGMVAEDAVFLPPGLPPIRGRQAVEALYRSFFPQFQSVEQTVILEEIVVTGDWAFTWGSEQFVLVPQSGGPPIEMQGKGLSILKRQADGSWKYARGINNTAQRPGAPPC